LSWIILVANINHKATMMFSKKNYTLNTYLTSSSHWSLNHWINVPLSNEQSWSKVCLKPKDPFMFFPLSMLCWHHNKEKYKLWHKKFAHTYTNHQILMFTKLVPQSCLHEGQCRGSHFILVKRVGWLHDLRWTSI